MALKFAFYMQMLWDILLNAVKGKNIYYITFNLIHPF